jgi:hypothetical protein
MNRTTLCSSLSALVLGLAIGAAPILAHDEPSSGSYDLLIPGMMHSSQVSLVTLVGPDAGEEVLHTTFNLTFFSPAGGTLGSDVLLNLTMPTEGVDPEIVITGADLGWPATTGTHSGSFDTDLLNGVLTGGLGGGLPFSTPEVVMDSVIGGLTGQYIDSTITLELAGEFCQTDLGFAGPGLMRMEICGEPLSSGNSAELTVTRAPPSALVFLAVSTTANPTPFYGGTLVPLPLLVVLAAPADATGTLALLVPGGAGPVTAYVQAVVEDASEPLGYALSNALEVELLP